jgi:hypothetical protein
MGKPSCKAQTDNDESTNMNEDIEGMIVPVTDIMETDKLPPTSASGFGECKEYYKNHQELKPMYDDRGQLCCLSVSEAKYGEYTNLAYEMQQGFPNNTMGLTCIN